MGAENIENTGPEAPATETLGSRVAARQTELATAAAISPVQEGQTEPAGPLNARIAEVAAKRDQQARAEWNTGTPQTPEQMDPERLVRERMTTAMQKVDRTIAALEPISGEAFDKTILRVRGAVHDVGFTEINRPL